MSIYRFIASLLAINFVVMASAVHAVEFNDADYEIYIGDINDDGIDDVYLQAMDGLILLHGDIITPIVIPPSGPSYAILSNGNSYSEPVVQSGVDTSNFALLTSDDYTVSDINGDGLDDLLINPVGNMPFSVSIAGSNGNTPVLIPPPVVTQYTYDALGRLIKVHVNDVEKSSYQYDAAGNRTNVVDEE